tara:strand:+ start:5112 stop:5378 length:267 start_codon:yes stop_codon:yes gene_type:complete
MFTLKFFKKKSDDDAQVSSVVSAKSYQKYEQSNGVTMITVYDSPFQTDGVTYNISESEREFIVCYVENASGKTIDTIHAADKPHAVIG